jgi:chaperonin GroEL
VPGGGVALLNAAKNISSTTQGANIFKKAISEPYFKILQNSDIDFVYDNKKGYGVDVTTGKTVNMFKKGIVDPVLVTKTALKNAVSVATTILSTDCVINNIK